MAFQQMYGNQDGMNPFDGQDNNEEQNQVSGVYFPLITNDNNDKQRSKQRNNQTHIKIASLVIDLIEALLDN